MKKLKPKITNVKFIAISAVLLIAFGVLFSLIPYSAEDWAWGSQVGIDRLKGFFAEVDGCYFGNILSILLTRSVLLKCIVQSVFMTALCAAPYFLVKSKNVFTVILTALLTLLAPKQFFVQSVAYVTGFSKLIPALVLNLVYIYMVRNLFSDSEPNYKKYAAYISFIIAFISGISCEYFALFGVLFALLMIVFCRLKFYDAKNVNLFYLLGAILGAVLTFSNESYYEKAQSSILIEDYGIVKNYLYKLLDNAGLVSINLVHKNIVIITIITVLFLAYGIWHIRKNGKKDLKTLLICAALAGAVVSDIISAYVFYRHIHGVEGMLRHDVTMYYILMIASAAPVLIFLVFNILLLINDKKRKEFMLFMFVLPLVFSLSTLFFKEFNEGAFFGVRIYYVVICALLIEHMAERIKPTPLAKKTIILATGAYLLVSFVILFGAYRGVNETEKERAYYRAIQNQIGQQTIYIKRNDDQRLYLPNPDTNESTYWYKVFYDLDIGAELVVLDDEEYEEFKKEFDTAIEEGGVELKNEKNS